MRSSFAIFACIVLVVSFGRLATAADPVPDVKGEEQEIVTKYLDAAKAQEKAMLGSQWQVEITAKLPKQAKQGTLKALRIMSKVGKISYHALDFLGDNEIKKEVIARYLDAETEARANGSIAISPDNYKFKLKQHVTQNQQDVWVFELTPKKPYRVGEFKGELRIDGATGMPLQETGQLVKNPSIFLKKVTFERDYAIQDGVALPAHISSTVKARFVGTAELDINFSNFTHDEANQAALQDPANP